VRKIDGRKYTTVGFGGSAEVRVNKKRLAARIG
jgi:hypothetical protein